MKRKANALASTWDEVIYDESLSAMLEDTVQRVERNDPGKGRWDVVGEEATVWVVFCDVNRAISEAPLLSTVAQWC